ncbi:MAG: MFS transporter, partial [Pseudomonadota bacterium]
GGVGALLALRLVEAFGFTLVIAAAPAIVQARAAAPDRGLALGVWGVWLPLGQAGILAVALLALPLLGWRGMTLVSAAACLAAGLWVAMAVPRDPRLGMPRLRLRALVRRRLALITLGFVAFAGANMIVFAFLPTLLIDTAGLSPRGAAAAAILASLLIMPGNVLGGWFLGRGVAVGTILLLGLGGMAVFAVVLFAEGVAPGLRLVATAAFSLAAGFAPGAIWASIPALAENPDEAPVISGVLFQGAGLGQLLGPLLTGVAVEAAGGWQGGMIVALALLAPGLGAALLLGRR